VSVDAGDAHNRFVIVVWGAKEAQSASSMRLAFAFVVIVACPLSCRFSMLAANEERLAAESPSEESLYKSDEKAKEAVTPDSEGFYGVPDGVIDDPDGYVDSRKEKSGDSPIIAKVKKDEPFKFQCAPNAAYPQTRAMA